MATTVDAREKGGPEYHECGSRSESGEEGTLQAPLRAPTIRKYRGGIKEEQPCYSRDKKWDSGSSSEGKLLSAASKKAWPAAEVTTD